LNPCPRRRASTSIAGCRKNQFNKNTYHLMQKHEEIVESEIHKLMESMKIKAINNNLTPRRTRASLLLKIPWPVMRSTTRVCTSSSHRYKIMKAS